MDLRSHKAIDKLFQPQAMMYPAWGYVLDNNAQSLKQVKHVLYQVRNSTILKIKTMKFAFFTFILISLYIGSKTVCA